MCTSRNDHVHHITPRGCAGREGASWGAWAWQHPNLVIARGVISMHVNMSMHIDSMLSTRVFALRVRTPHAARMHRMRD